MINVGKLPMRTPNLADKNYTALTALFPNAVTETVDENGVLVRAIDVDILAQEINARVVSGRKERYQFTWPDKKKAILLANAPIAAVLRPCRAESVNFDNTKNLYIEGDNLKALKLLRGTYLNQVKMIYIDPPYNTGNDLLYSDQWAADSKAWLEISGVPGEKPSRLVKNLGSSGRLHTEWLNMIYPRLRVARDLLTDDGVIFISIDDNELANLRKICDEVFGEDNFVNIVSVKMKTGAGASGGGEDKRLKKNLEYILIYVKDYQRARPFNAVYSYQEISELLKEYRERNVSWKYTSVLYYEGKKKYLVSTTDGKGNEIKIFERLNPVYKSVNQVAREENKTVKEVYYDYFDKIFSTAMPQSSIRLRVIEAIGEIDSSKDLYSIEYVPSSGRNKGKMYEQYYKGGKKRLLTWLKDVGEKKDGNVYKRDIKGTYWDGYNLNNLTKEGNVRFENGKKPLALIMDMIRMATSGDDIILDFFSGSATTAHAVMQLNAEDNGKRSFIMVQYPEVIVPSNKNSKRYISYLKKENIKPLISEIGKERIRRAGRKVLSDQWGTVSKDKELLKEYGCKGLSGADCPTEGGGTGKDNRMAGKKAAESKTGNTAASLHVCGAPCRFGYFGNDKALAEDRENEKCPYKNTEHCPLVTDHFPDIGFRVLKLDSINATR